MQKHEHVIIKRVKKHGHDEQHGGAWKVAFADFMIALMALFLVLWILQVADEDERKAIVAQMSNMSVFDHSFGSPFISSPSISPIDLGQESSVPSRHNSNHAVSSFFRGNGDGPESDSLIPGNFDTQEQLALLAKVVNHVAEQISAQDNVEVIITPQGLRIVLQDDFKQNMFRRGGSKLTPFFEDLLLELATIFQRVSNPIIISGHTDAIPFNRRKSDKSNWELSMSRANVARQTLVEGGMPDEHVLQVTGMSDRTLLNSDKPDSSENRRIELFVLTTSATKVLRNFFGNEADSDLNKAKNQAKFNQPVIHQKVNHASLAQESTAPAIQDL